MGNESSKEEDAVKLLNEDEKRDLEGVFAQLTTKEGESKKKVDDTATFDYKAFKEFSKSILPDDISQRLFNLMAHYSNDESRRAANRAALFVIASLIVKGSDAEKAMIFAHLGSASTGETISSNDLQHLCCSLISAAFNSKSLHPRASVWGGKDPDSNRRLARVFLDNASFQPDEEGNFTFDVPQLEKWLSANSLIQRLFNAVFQGCFFTASTLASHDETDSAKAAMGESPGVASLDLSQPLLPRLLKQKAHGPSGEESAGKSLLDATSVLFLNSHIPLKHRHLWRQLFSSVRDGESFARLTKEITGRGPTIVIVEDTDGYVFGGFASESWETSPNFVGDDQCFLFTLSPHMAIYTPTGYNNHYMYFNQGQQTIPNGLGMGGQHEYFGLWLDHDYGSGHSKAHPRSTTYNSPQLSKEEEFKIAKLEVWAVGLPVESQRVDGSVLDTNLDVQVLMELFTGKAVSGLYEPKSVTQDDEDDEK